MANNDARGWVMSAVSGVACVLGATVICADVVLRRIMHDKSFQIAKSNNFLSASLCLSAGVMLFTSLYSMLPNSKEYLTRAGFSSPASAYILTGLFLAGVIVIQFVSGFIHRFIPSHVVDCAHTHEPDNDPERGEGSRGELPDHHTNGSNERTPLLQTNHTQSFTSTPAVLQRTNPASKAVRPGSLRTALSRRLTSLMGGVKTTCDEDGPCYGVSQKCGRECTKILPNSSSLPPHPGLVTQSDDTHSEADANLDSTKTTSNPGYFDAVTGKHPRHPITAPESSVHAQPLSRPHISKSQVVEHNSHHSHHHESNHHQENGEDPHSLKSGGDTHHHHVPQNAFLSIGLQTSLAIALHKLPEGFITYATNHANPTLGFTVFLALFIHNIVEGFAMALPLYLALSSRWKAMFWSSLLGGISQPAGAGIAALWIWVSGRTSQDPSGPSWGIYGGMFAATAGVMTSVALQLFSEGLGLTHRRGVGIGFAVAGMGLMGLSFALTA
ncbi:hypothetical protein N7468_003088 [Penicillium chermesinum]|uniref:Zinc/iron permease n=1 Tax=Penicillium chermesinum TaxID=63820 RepID=A0A9W9P5Z4_9EURO|nr:uncharacterized protein N7468_003088 [Penicillium chermesinum]KAJ5238469.1 hypothetical protein N7468_003088 [Penicillium chermesinum]